MSSNLEVGGKTENNKPAAPSSRLMSLDALRGFDMFWIVGGSSIVYSLNEFFPHPVTAFLKGQMSHVPWRGFCFYDLIMPLFLFIVGTAMPFSFSKQLASGQPKTRIYGHIVRRVVILWILGMMLQGKLLSYDVSLFKFYSNTLQAIAAGYLFSSIIMLQFKLRWQIIITVSLLLVYWALLAWVPVPGYGAGVLTEKGNLAYYVEQLVLGQFADKSNYTWVLSSITFTATVMFGVMAGNLLRSNHTPRNKVLLMLCAGVALILAGEIWDIWFPIIKHIWTSSFVLFSGGLCCMLLGVFYLVIDVWGYKKWTFGFIVLGINAIAAYFSVHLFDFHLITAVFLGGLKDRLGGNYNLINEIATFVLVWLILYWMYRKKTFIKV